MTYTFRNRFRVNRLDADVPEIKLADSASDGVVTVWPVQREEDPDGGFVVAIRTTKRGPTISRASELVLQGDGYVSADEATKAGREWRQNLTAALAREYRAVDFGSDDQIAPVADVVHVDHPPEILKRVGIVAGDRVIADDARLLVYRTEPIPKFLDFIAGTPTVTVTGWSESFEQSVKRVREKDRSPWSTEKALAYRLVHLSLQDSNRETRHIQLVTAIEVLLKRQDRPKPILDALDELRTVVNGWPEGEVKQRTTEILRQNNEESILRAGVEQVAAKLESTYWDKPPKEFFKHVYNFRSRLVHRARNNENRPTTGELDGVYAHLLKFVLDALDGYETD